MKNPSTILCFGDSLTDRYSPVFTQQIMQKFPDINFTIINAGISGETSRDGLRRLPHMLDTKPDVVIIGFGMNDLGKEEPDRVPQSEFAENLSQMNAAFEQLMANYTPHIPRMDVLDFERHLMTLDDKRRHMERMLSLFRAKTRLAAGGGAQASKLSIQELDAKRLNMLQTQTALSARRTYIGQVWTDLRDSGQAFARLKE